MSVIRAATVHNHNRSRRTSSSESPTGGTDHEDHDSSQVFEPRGTDVSGIDSEYTSSLLLNQVKPKRRGNGTENKRRTRVLERKKGGNIHLAHQKTL